MVEWVEVRGRTVDVAVAAGMQELGITDREAVEIELIQEPEKGFLGLGGRDAIVRVKPRPQGRRRRRGRGSERPGPSDRRDRPREGGEQSSKDRQPMRQTASREGGNRPSGASAGPRRGSSSPPAGQGERFGERGSGAGRGGGGGRPPRDGGNNRDRPRGQGPRRDAPRPARTTPSTADPNEQAPMVDDFLTGLLESFGLEGRVVVNIDEDVIVAAIEGEQTAALVGPRGSVMEAIHEITKTVLHRQVSDTARVRIDISGYAERRRQALSIYAGQLIDQVLGEGGEIMLEPMSAADRKVIHDAVAARDGVESYSEGEPPRRYVVIATTDDDANAGSDSWVDSETPAETEPGAATEAQEELEGDDFEAEDQDEPSSST